MNVEDYVLYTELNQSNSLVLLLYYYIGKHTTRVCHCGDTGRPLTTGKPSVWENEPNLRQRTEYEMSTLNQRYTRKCKTRSVTGLGLIKVYNKS